MKCASEEWLTRHTALQQSFAVRPGATARVQFRLTNAPDGAKSGTTPISATAGSSNSSWVMIPPPTAP